VELRAGEMPWWAGDCGIQSSWEFWEKPTSGFEPLTPSLRDNRGVCRWLWPVALAAWDRPTSAVAPTGDLLSVQGAGLPTCFPCAVPPFVAWRSVVAHLTQRVVRLARPPSTLGAPRR
jgi:hypothetical protein